MLKTFTQNIGTITIGAILLGYYDLYTYYEYFGVNIYSYVDPSEIIFSISSVFKAFVVFLSLFLWGTISSQITYSEKKDTTYTTKVEIYLIGVRKSARILLGIILFILVAFLAQLLSDALTSVEDLDLIFLYIFTLLVYVLVSRLSLISLIIKKKNFDYIKKIWTFSGVDAAIVFLLTIFLFTERSMIRHRNVVDGFPKYSNELVFESSTYPNRKSIFYVGATRSHYFYYDSLSKQVHGIPSSAVKFIYIKELRKGL